MKEAEEWPRNEPAAKALRHPTRIRILEAVNERDLSPVQFVNLTSADPEKALPHVSYHFRQLKEYGCLEVVDRVARRGAVEHIYRGKARAYFSDEEWAELDPEEARLLSRAMYQGLAARAEAAMLCDTFDSRADRHLTWDVMELDEPGWEEAMRSLMRCFVEMKRIGQDAQRRLSVSAADGIRVTVGILGFESPPPAAPSASSDGAAGEKRQD